MLFKKKTTKRHEDEPFLIAHILRGSGSVSSLLHFVSTHPGGADAARKDIIKIKYWYSKCSPVVQNIVRKMVKEFQKFSVDKDYFRGTFTDDTVEHFEIVDTDTRLKFRVNSSSCKIEIPSGNDLSRDLHDWTLFLYATRSVLYIKNNIDEMRKSQANERTKQNYVEAYK